MSTSESDLQGPGYSSETIAFCVEKVLKAFNTVSAVLVEPERPYKDQIQLSDIGDEHGRFRIWSGNIGAHRGGRSSLDYRLRDASHIRQRVISLLQDLTETLQDRK